MDQFDEKRKELEERKNNIISSMSYKQKEIETLLIESRDRKDHLYKLRFKMPDDSWIIIHFILSAIISETRFVTSRPLININKLLKIKMNEQAYYPRFQEYASGARIY